MSTSRVLSRAGISLLVGSLIAVAMNAAFGLQLEPFTIAFGLLVGFLAGGED